MTWQHESRRHSLASRGIKTKNPKIKLDGRRVKYTNDTYSVKKEGKTVGFIRKKPLDKKMNHTDETKKCKWFYGSFYRPRANNIASQLNKEGYNAQVVLSKEILAEDNAGMKFYDVFITR